MNKQQPRTPMSEMLTRAQSLAPSYLLIADDGASFHCHECGKHDREQFIKPFTPDGIFHSVVHKGCADPHWLEHAKCAGTL